MLGISLNMKLLMSTGVVILILWLVLVMTTAFNMNSFLGNNQPLQQEEVNQMPDNPWRTMSFSELTIPEKIKEEAKKLTVNDQVQQIEGADIFIRSATPEASKSKLTLLFLHGAAFTSTVWERLNTLQIMGALGFKSIAIDLPEFGRSRGKITNTRVRFMEKLFQQLGLDHVVMIVPSRSGEYAIPFLLSHPESIAGFVPIAPGSTGVVSQMELKSVKVPTLYIWGSKDTGIGVKSREDLKIIPNFQAVVLENAGHAAYLDQTDAFHNVLYNFLVKLNDTL